MKIKIKDYSWGINRRTGDMSETLCESVVYDAIDGLLPPIGIPNKQFEVQILSDNKVKITLNAKGDFVILKSGEKHTYKPWSFDGGHYYVIEVE